MITMSMLTRQIRKTNKSVRAASRSPFLKGDHMDTEKRLEAYAEGIKKLTEKETKEEKTENKNEKEEK